MNNYDPYHQCATWEACCKRNISFLDTNLAYRKLIDKYGKYSKTLNFTYSFFFWYDECFFEDLPNPDVMLPTDCGVCFICISSKGKSDCVFKQNPNTYKKWHIQK